MMRAEGHSFSVGRRAAVLSIVRRTNISATARCAVCDPTHLSLYWSPPPSLISTVAANTAIQWHYRRRMDSIRRLTKELPLTPAGRRVFVRSVNDVRSSERISDFPARTHEKNPLLDMHIRTQTHTRSLYVFLVILLLFNTN